MEYTFTWFIENYSYCSHQRGEKLRSPEFFPKGQESSAWCIGLYPRGSFLHNKGHVTLFLERSMVDNGPERISLKYDLSILKVDGTALLWQGDKGTFEKGNVVLKCCLEMKEVFRQKSTVLPQDVLCVRCTMWIDETDVDKEGQGFARTRIGVEHISFIHVVKDFSTLASNRTRSLQIRIKEAYVKSSIYLADSSCCDGRLIFKVSPSCTKRILLKYNLFLLSASGFVTKCGEEDIRFDSTRKEFNRLLLPLTRHDILKKRSQLLPDDKLTLICECSFSTGVEFEKIEKTLYEIPSFVLHQIHNGQNIGRSNVAEKLSACPSAIDDLKAFYITQLPTDVEIKTKTKSFPAHKNLLRARSPVFKAMLTNDMQEKNTDCIQLYDLENDTVEALLHFLYSDNLENIKWDSAIKLYFEADKYAIEKLKLMCSSFLIDSLSISNASELLLLAGSYNDSCLHRPVVDFILKHEYEVFPSKEWVKFINDYPVLASMTIIQKYIRRN